MKRRGTSVLVVVLSMLTLSACGGGGGMGAVFNPPPPPQIQPTTFTNPITPKNTAGAAVESCPDPSIIYSAADKFWYVYCTGNPINDNDKNGNVYRDHFVTVHRSSDLASWTYIGDAFTSRPAWVPPTTGTWAPNIEYFNGKYFLYYTIPDTALNGGGSAIGVATSDSPAGPWTHAAQPVIEPHKAQCCQGSNRWVIDSDVVEHNGELYIYYGTFYGGVSVRKLSADGLQSDPGSEVQITIPDRYEAAHVVKRDGFYYLFVSAANCCNGPLTGYSVFVGRAATPTGPFLDREGRSLLDGRAGGTLVLSFNGDKWIGVGHNAVFTDFARQDWTVYHAVDRTRPYFAGVIDTRRPLMMDAVDWVEGWPVVRGGYWTSSTPQPLPAAQPGQAARYTASLRPAVSAGASDAGRSDEFNTNTLNPKWTWIRQPATGVRMTGSSFEFDTQNAELHEASNTASILAQAAPAGDYMVETRFRLNVPANGCCQDYTQAGLVLFSDDDNYVKLVHASIGWSRQIEFGKEVFPVQPGYPRYGGMPLEAPGDWTYLRLLKRTSGGEEQYTAFSSLDGVNWTRGGTWTHALGAGARFGLVSMSRSGYTAEFDYVRVYSVAP